MNNVELYEKYNNREIRLSTRKKILKFVSLSFRDFCVFGGRKKIFGNLTHNKSNCNTQSSSGNHLQGRMTKKLFQVFFQNCMTFFLADIFYDLV